MCRGGVVSERQINAALTSSSCYMRTSGVAGGACGLRFFRATSRAAEATNRARQRASEDASPAISRVDFH